MTNWDLIVDGDALKEAASVRKQKIIRVSRVPLDRVPVYENDGYRVDNLSKDQRYYSMVKDKSQNDIFENHVWMTLYNMGFTRMNKDNSFVVDFGGNSKQIDIFAMDDETCLFVECKSAATMDKSATFKTELESIQGYKGDLINAVKHQFGDKYKFKFIFATNNYVISDADKMRMNDFHIIHLDQDGLSYYDSLVEQLGKSARYQLLGSLFQGQVIKNLENRVCALRGSMGGQPYYMFCIEPDRLLKMAYILHRTKANSNVAATYQRLVKKDRLKAIREFVNNGGYFPNSVIVSIDSDRRDLRFDPFPPVKIDSPVTSGVLYLPQKYHSMYVIDGQHRLYGYSESDYAETNVIPVVAFVDMDSEKQVKMFMDINENQKAVSKSLRNTLLIDLYWSSNDVKKRQDALMLKLAEYLGEVSSSPLYKRILVGEDKQTDYCCITTEYIKDAIKQSHFLNEYSKNNVKRVGTFDCNDNEETLRVLGGFLIRCFTCVADSCVDEWNAGAAGFLSINNMIYALIRVFDDIVNIRLQELHELRALDVHDMFLSCEGMLHELIDVINGLSQTEKDKIKTAKGGSAKKESWRILQLAFNRRDPKFINADLQQYIDDHCMDNHDSAVMLVSKLHHVLVTSFQNAIFDSEMWQHVVPERLHEDLAQRQAVENVRRQRNGDPAVDIWDLISFDDLSQMLRYSDNWTFFIKDIFSAAFFVEYKKNDACQLLINLSSYDKKLAAGNDLTKADYDSLSEIVSNLNDDVIGE